MALAISKRPGMTLFCCTLCARSHRTRLVAAEKNIPVDVVEVNEGEYPEDLTELNPYHSLPTLVDRELALYDSGLIVEYFDERYPHPPLMPVDPVLRAKTRLMLYRIERDWYSALDTLEYGKDSDAANARQIIRDGLSVIAPLFKQTPFFMSGETTLIDCYLAPLLWRLPHYGIVLPKEAQALEDYGQRLFKRRAFQASLSADEKKLRQ